MKKFEEEKKQKAQKREERKKQQIQERLEAAQAKDFPGGFQGVASKPPTKPKLSKIEQKK